MGAGGLRIGDKGGSLRGGPLEDILDLTQTARDVEDRCIDDLHARRTDCGPEEARVDLLLVIGERFAPPS
jgi:hypothetical protein